jgi:hypothetical protein
MTEQVPSDELAVAVSTERLTHMVDTLSRDNDAETLEFDRDVLVCLKELQTMREIIAKGGNVYTTWLMLRNMVEIAG